MLPSNGPADPPQNTHAVLPASSYFPSLSLIYCPRCAAAPPSDYVSQILSAHSPLPGAKRREPLPRPSPQAATDYTTESKSAFAGNPEGYGKVHSISFYERPGNTDTFLARLQIAEQSDNQKRMSLIPRVG